MDQDERSKKETMVATKIPIPTGIPFLYTNGILVGTTVADVSFGITINGQLTHQLNMSYTTAKTLLTNLQIAISDFEKKTDSKILEMREISEKMNAGTKK